MIIWKYYAAGTEQRTSEYYGTPVDVMIHGRQLQVVYQFGDGKNQRPAVVHFASGQIMALIADHHTGYPLRRAQQALNELAQMHDVYRIFAAFSGAPIINEVPMKVFV